MLSPTLSPSRSTPSVTGAPPDCEMARVTSAVVSMGAPFTVINSSPTRRPASAAFSSTSATRGTTVVRPIALM